METAVCALLPVAACNAAEPSFSCRRAANAAERLICNDNALAALDRKLAEVFGAAGRTPSPYTDLGSSQREFTRARNDCWQAPDFRECLEEAYVQRIAQLQIQYRLVTSKGPFRYLCDADPPGELKATFFATDPPSATLEYDGESLIASLKQVKAAARYEARNASFRERNGEATVTWGKAAKEMRCTVQK